MFDQLIESEPEGADFKNRRTYFMVSSVVVGVLFAAAVVVSIYASEIGLGNSAFELTEIIAPPEMAADQPETPKNEPQRSSSQSTTTTRQANMERVDEATVVPTTTSVVPNLQRARPTGSYQIGTLDRDAANPGSSGRETYGVSSSEGGLTKTTAAADSAPEPEPEPPPVKKDPAPVKRVISEGVINGKATALPIPAYPAAAKAVGATGKVDVEVMIDESGKVISAHAISGHPLLRDAAQRAAWGARFSPTLLSKVPVKVTGVIVYNFNR